MRSELLGLIHNHELIRPAAITGIQSRIGYDRACAIAQQAHHHQLNLKEAALALGELSAEEFDRWVQPEEMI